MTNHILKKIFPQKDIDNAWQLIQQSKNITLLTHENPDGDGVSACAALSLFLEKLGGKIETIYPNKPEFNYKRQGANIIINHHKQQPDLLIASDTAIYKKLYFPSDFKTIPLINIDHHISNTIQGTYNFVNPTAASACEELYVLLKEWDHSLINTQIAECLLFGIVSDSQVFRIKLTSARTLRIAAELIDYGVDLFKIKNELLTNKNPNIIALWGNVLSHIQFSTKGNAAWVCLTQEDFKKFNVKPSSLVGLNNFLSEITNIDITLIFYETEDNKTKVSLRSKTGDVNKLASHFGGGGHTNAAGILSNIPIPQLVEKIQKLL